MNLSCSLDPRCCGLVKERNGRRLINRPTEVAGMTLCVNVGVFKRVRARPWEWLNVLFQGDKFVDDREDDI